MSDTGRGGDDRRAGGADAVTGALRSLVREGPLYVVATALQLVAATVALPLVTRQLDPSAYGVVATAFIVMQTLGLVATLGLPAAVTREYFLTEDPVAGRRRAVQVAFAAVGLSVVVVGVVHLLGPVWAPMLFDEVGYGATLRLAVWSAVPAAAVLSAQAVLRATRSAGRFVVMSLVGAVGGQVLGVAMLVHRPEPAWYIGGVAAASCLAGVLGMWWSRPDRFELPDPGLVRRALRVGLGTVPHGLAIVLLAIGDRVVIERLRGLEAVGRYQVGYAVGTLGIRLLVAVNNAWAPIVYAARPADEQRVLDATTARVTQLAAFAAAGLAITAPILLTAMAPESYRPADLADITAVAALTAVPYASYLASSQLIMKAGTTAVLAWAGPLCAVANLVLVAGLVSVLGLSGAAMASVVTYGLLAGIIRWRTGALGQTQWRVRPVAGAYAAASVVVAAAVVLPVDGSWLGLRAAAGTVLALWLVARLVLAGRRPADPAGPSVSRSPTP